MFRKAVHKNESGVALLFALGILSLLLVLGLAFASNALLAQKVARNNSNRSQAKLLAQSAISRIATAIMYYQFQAANWITRTFTATAKTKTTRCLPTGCSARTIRC